MLTALEVPALRFRGPSDEVEDIMFLTDWYRGGRAIWNHSKFGSAKVWTLKMSKTTSDDAQILRAERCYIQLFDLKI